MTEPDLVKHPAHYATHPSGVECWEVNEVLPANLAATVKYIWRKDGKGCTEQDLRKAWQYLEREHKRALQMRKVYQTILQGCIGAHAGGAWLALVKRVVEAEIANLPPTRATLLAEVLALIATFAAGKITTERFFPECKALLKTAMPAEAAP